MSIIDQDTQDELLKADELRIGRGNQPASPLAPDAAHEAGDGVQFVVVRVTDAMIEAAQLYEMSLGHNVDDLSKLHHAILRAADADVRPLREIVAELLYYKGHAQDTIKEWEHYITGNHREYWLRLADATLAEYAAGGKE